MDHPARRAPIIMGRAARVELCPCGDSLVLTVGPLSIRLDHQAAEDVAATLLEALSRVDPRRVPTIDLSDDTETGIPIPPEVPDKKRN
jgi:hypothetical protein